MNKDEDDDDDDDDRPKLLLQAINTSPHNWQRYVLRELRYSECRAFTCEHKN